MSNPLPALLTAARCADRVSRCCEKGFGDAASNMIFLPDDGRCLWLTRDSGGADLAFLVFLQTIVEELEESWNVLLVDERAAERHAVVVECDVVRLGQITELCLFEPAPLVADSAQFAGVAFLIFHIYRI